MLLVFIYFMATKTCATMFSGVGGSESGLKGSGYQPSYAIEWNQGSIDILKANHDIPLVIHNDVTLVDYSKLPEVDLLWASPVCCSFSRANFKGGENNDDIKSTFAILLAAKRSQSVIIENVPAYKNSESYSRLKLGLGQQGFYFSKETTINAAKYGNPARRDRFYAIFSRSDFRTELPPEFQSSWVEMLLKYQDYWVESKLTVAQQNAIDGDHSRPIPGSIYAVERCGYYKYPKIYNGLSPYPCIKSHTHHDGKNPKPGRGKIGSYRSYMDFVYEGQSYSVTPQLLGVLNGFPIDYRWGSDRAMASAGIGNAVVPRLAQIVSGLLT